MYCQYNAIPTCEFSVAFAVALFQTGRNNITGIALTGLYYSKMKEYLGYFQS